MTNFIQNARLGITTLGFVAILIVVKIFLYQLGWEFLATNSLYTSAISGAVFIMGFLLAGVFADYKEAERSPAELRSALESIWEDANTFKQLNPSFDLEAVRKTLKEAVQGIFSGLSHEQKHSGLGPVFTALEKLSPVFVQMEKLGHPANHVVRLKSERSAAKKILLRIQHMQRTQFVPSVYFLAESIVFAVISLLLFLKSEGALEFFVLFAFISYIFIYVARLIPVLEQPFREGHGTRDDVSLFLLHQFEGNIDRALAETT